MNFSNLHAKLIFFGLLWTSISKVNTEICDSFGGDRNDCAINNKVDVDCSGRGNCICGICECIRRPSPSELIYGRYCECDNFSCPKNNGLICSGYETGTCVCGACMCHSGWTGDACDCPTALEKCIVSGSEEICSGHGNCECGRCRCYNSEEGVYNGRYCEEMLNF